ncbi:MULTISPECIES: hypothetical protein [Mycolicibacter]|uniref:Uncharacterized protein n=2 Tax=Mycolicibacter TaxID=1073531 RepID=A0ABU5XMH1_9MYCO|nr:MULTISPECIES: hypothetical protein [unclassified Mycolicibacter]MEB3023480.1 hypothetical protein [Mycolicibacter sp. MYC098]MEB3035099.1 hypothetical protein [Mycolicibacter sp. MYC340]
MAADILTVTPLISGVLLDHQLEPGLGVQPDECTCKKWKDVDADGQAGNQIPFIDHQAAAVADDLGFTPEFAVCVLDDGGAPIPRNTTRCAYPERASIDAKQLPASLAAFTGCAFTTRWRRVDA